MHANGILLLIRSVSLIFFALGELGVLHASGLNDSGVTICYDGLYGLGTDKSVAADGGTHPRQDCRYGRDPAAAASQFVKTGGGGKSFDYTKIAYDGTVADVGAALGEGTNQWACTKDNVTGLVWEVKTTFGLRNQSHTYTWYSEDTASNGGSKGEASGGTCFGSATQRCDTEKFAFDVNAVRLCARTNWRMPTRKELIDLMDFGQINPTIQTTYFPNTPNANFWSGSPDAAYPSYAWTASFGTGKVDTISRGELARVRLVSGP